MKNNIKRIVIAGGGTAGWMTAAMFSEYFKGIMDVILVESDTIGTVGVGEATIPPIRVFHRILNIDEQEFMRVTQATFKLGIGFDGWRSENQDYIHSFGKTGKEYWACDFQNFWLRAKELGIECEYGDFCYELQAAKAEKFGVSEKSSINYAYHLDASRYAKYLRSYSEARGVKRIEGLIDNVAINTDSGFIESLQLDSGECVAGDLFIDCTGFRALLIDKVTESRFEDWSHWLKADRAVALQTTLSGPAVPYTKSVAHDAGWRWRIPLQHRVGNGFVYSSQYLGDDQAVEELASSVSGDTVSDPRVIKFKTGRRAEGWSKNCIALGLASGFVEPLESTSIHLVMSSLVRLIKLLPSTGSLSSVAREYNAQTNRELENIRDFIILHYHINGRKGSPYWRDYANMDIPDTLKHRIELFKESGRAFNRDGEVFIAESWVQVMLGQGITPHFYNPIVSAMSKSDLEKLLAGIRQAVDKSVARLPNHNDFVQKYCAAEKP